MCASRWIKVTLLLHLFCSATSSPMITHAPAVALASPFSTISPSEDRMDSVESARCPLTLSPASLVVRFGDPVEVNCSVPMKRFSLLGWVTSLSPEPTTNSFLVWKVDHLTEWSITSMCYALSDLEGSCHRNLPVLVFKPPDDVFLTLANHTGSLLEHHEFSLRCTVHNVAPARNLLVTFYRNQSRLARLHSNTTDDTPVTEVFALDIVATREDNGANYWCEAKLQLQPTESQKPIAVASEKVTTTVLFGPQLLCPAKLQVKMGESLRCDVRGNPEPSVIWLKDGRKVIPPTCCSREHAGKYTVLATGLFKQNVTVEVEVVNCRGTASACKRLFLLLALMVNLL